MNRFLRSVFYFSLLWCVVNVIVYRFITYPELYRDYEIKRSVEELKSYNKFIFSDSRGWRLTKGHPEVEDTLKAHSILNLSYGSDSYFDILFKLEYLLDNDVVPEALYISADEHMISKYRLRSNNRYRSIRLADYNSYSKYFPMTKAEFVIRKYLLPYFPLIKPDNSKLIREYLFSKFKNDNQQNRDETWEMLHEEEKIERCKTRYASHFPNNYFSVRLSKTLVDIFELASKKDIEVIGIKFPVAPHYRELLAQLPHNADSVFAHNKYSIINLRNNIKEDRYLSNQDHVNKLGAKRISVLLLDESFPPSIISD